MFPFSSFWCYCAFARLNLYISIFITLCKVKHSVFCVSREWYRRNFTITLLLARVTLNSMWRTVTERQSSKKNGTPTS